MKNLLILFLSTFLIGNGISQAPPKFHYQAVARDVNGTIITGSIGVHISFLQGGPDGVVTYQESHQANTQAQGIFNLNIGAGTVTNGDWDNLRFDLYEYWLKIEIKTPEAVGFTEMGKTQLLSVPYALYAAKSGSTLQPGNGIEINGDVITNTGDLSDNNELQQLSLNGNQLSISTGNTITLPSNSANLLPGDGIEFIGNTINAEDISPTNELQNLNLTGQLLTITNGNSVTIPANTAGPGIQIINHQISANDVSATNEIQTLSVNGNQLNLSNGGGAVQLPTSPWTVNNTSEITAANSNHSVVIGAASDYGSKLYVSASGTDVGGYFYAPSSSPAINAYCNGSGSAINAQSLNGTGATISSINGTAATFDGGAAPVVVINQNVNQNSIEMNLNGNVWGFQQHPLGTLYLTYNDDNLVWISHGDGSYHTFSDRSLKKDIIPFSDVLEKLTQLQAYTYHMKHADENSPLSLGLMAQEVEAQFPELVTTQDGYKSICYDHFAVLAVQAIKEQNVIMDAQQQQLEAQQSKLEVLEKTVEELKSAIAGDRK